jgi:hypothetical protein
MAQIVALSKKIPDYVNAEELEDDEDLVLRQFTQPVQSTHATPNSSSLLETPEVTGQPSQQSSLAPSTEDIVRVNPASVTRGNNLNLLSPLEREEERTKENDEVHVQFNADSDQSSSDSEASIIAAVSKSASKSSTKKKVQASTRATTVQTRKQNKTKAVTNKRLFSATTPSYNLPMMKNWEDCNARMHAIFGFSKDFSNTEAKTTLLEKLEHTYNCPSTFVGSFLTELMEMVKELMGNDAENKIMYEIWIDKIDKVSDEFNK